MIYVASRLPSARASLSCHAYGQFPRLCGSDYLLLDDMLFAYMPLFCFEYLGFHSDLELEVFL